MHSELPDYMPMHSDVMGRVILAEGIVMLFESDILKQLAQAAVRTCQLLMIQYMFCLHHGNCRDQYICRVTKLVSKPCT